MKKNFFIAILLFIGFTVFFVAFNNITKETTKNYETVSYTEVISKTKEQKDFILFVKKDGCIHCENVEPIINEAAKRKDIDIFAITSNKETNQNELIKELEISLYPTVIFFEKGNEKMRIVGEFDKQDLYKKIGE